MPRNLNSLTTAWLYAPGVDRFEFLDLHFTTGEEYWTNKPGDIYPAFDPGIGAPFDWDGTHSWIPGQFEQGDQSSFSVSDFTFYNADGSITDKMRAQGTYGFRGIGMDVYLCGFDRSDGSFIGSVVLWSGRFDRSEIGAGSVRFSIISHNNLTLVKIPRRRFMPSFGFNWIPLPNLQIPFGTSGTLTLPTAPKPPSTTGGPPPPPPPGEPTARQHPIVAAGGNPPTTQLPPRETGGRHTRTVGR